jgi:hypothetical protein
MVDKTTSEPFTVLADAPHIVATGERLSSPIRLDYHAVAATVPQDTKLALCAWFMEKCAEHAREGGSFRSLIYGRMGFGLEAFLPLYLAGGMELAHHFNFVEATAADEIVRTNIARVADRTKDVDDRDKLIDAMFRFEQLAEAASAWGVVIKQQRLELNGLSQYIGDLALSLRSAAELVKVLGMKLTELGGNADLGELIDMRLRLFEQTIDRIQRE